MSKNSHHWRESSVYLATGKKRWLDAMLARKKGWGFEIRNYKGARVQDLQRQNRRILSPGYPGKIF
jgi:hypothetical protein